MTQAETNLDEQIIELLIKKTGCGIDEIESDSDLSNDLGCTGDDFDELIQEYAANFNVDMSGYLWYFHHEVEGNNIGGTIFRPPNERVDHIAVTPSLLTEFAKTGKWLINYPEHKLPKYRFDLLFNCLLVVLFLVIFIYKCNS